MKQYFRGGVHNSDGSDKLLSSQIPIKEYLPDSVEISMKQSGFSICDVVVNKGDLVTKGQVIGQPVFFGGANIHASISGVVSDVKITKDSYDREVPIVVISSNKETFNEEPKTEHKYKKAIVDIDDFSKDFIIKSMENSGLIGMGGAGFPTHIKYETCKQIDYLIINGSECEPYLTCDHRTMLEYGYEMINGIKLLLKASNAKKAIICIEDNKTDAAGYLELLLENKGLPIDVEVLPTKYPQGGERQLIEAVLHKEVPAGGLPADLGVIVNNVGTAKALADSIFAGEPLISRIITVSGSVEKPSNFNVPIGTRYNELIELVGGYTSDNTRVIIGGPMTGEIIQRQGEAEELEGSVAKTTSALLVLDDYTLDESPCIRCGECERLCPAGLAPFKIDKAAIDNDISLYDKLYATECISCGVCSYVCPAKRELAYRITEAKNEIFMRRNGRGGE